MTEKELLTQLRDIFRHNDVATEMCVNLLVADKSLLKKIRAFVKMSGYESEVNDKEGGFEIHIFGTSCRCG